MSGAPPDPPTGYAAWLRAAVDEAHTLLESWGSADEHCDSPQHDLAVSQVLAKHLPTMPADYREHLIRSYITEHGQDLLDEWILRGKVLPLDGGMYVAVPRDVA